MKKFLIIFILIIILINSFAYYVFADENSIEVHFLSTGISDAILIKAEGKNYILDTGADYSSNHMIDYLKKQKITSIDEIILTHYHEDHYGGLKEIIKNFNVHKLFITRHMVPMNKEIFKEGIQNNVEVRYLSNDYAIKGKNFCLNSWLPKNMNNEGEKESEINNHSLILYGNIFGKKIIFCGDAEYKEEEEFLKTNSNKSFDIIKVPHHGLNTSLSGNFLKNIKGEIAIITCDGTSSPSKEIINKLSDNEIEVLRTDRLGDIKLEINSDIMVIEAEK